MREPSISPPSRTPLMISCRIIGLYFYCVLLTVLAGALIGIIATVHHWMPSLIR